MLNDSTISLIIEAGMSHNADLAEVFIDESKSNGVSLLNKNVISCSSAQGLGVGIRLIKGTNVVYVFSNDPDSEGLINMAKEAAMALESGKEANIREIESLSVTDPSKVVRSVMQLRKSELIDYLMPAIDFASNYNPLITQTSSRFAVSDRTIRIVNSRGVNKQERRQRSRAVLSVIATKGNEKQTATLSPGTLRGFEFFDEYKLLEETQKRCDSAIRMLDAGYAPSGKMPVIIGNGFGGVIFHEACGHTLEATSVGIKSSPFTDMLGKAIASPVVSARDNARIEGEWGSYSTDDEGNESSDLLLIENGILKNYLVDELGSRRMNCPVTGCGRRQSYTYAPTSRMSNTYICEGNDKPEDIIADTEYGLYATDMGGGSVDTSTGEFNFAVNEAFMIRKGKIAEPVRGATLIGKGPEILMNIDRVGNDLKLAVGMCGSISGSVPVTVGQPTIRVSSILVGGREE